MSWYRARSAPDSQDRHRDQYEEPQWANRMWDLGGSGLVTHGYGMYRPFLVGSAQACVISHIDVLSRGSYDAGTIRRGYLTPDTL